MFTAGFLPREVALQVYTLQGLQRLGTHRVRPPTAREAITLLETVEAAYADEDAWYAASGILRGWLPVRLSSILLSKRINRSDALRLGLLLLTVGIDDIEQHEQNVQEAKKRAGEIGWQSIIADYRSTIGGSLNEPWGFFVAQCRKLPEIRAKAEVSFISGYATAKTGTGYKELLRRAGYTAEEIEEMSEEEERRWINQLEMEARKAGLFVGGNLDHLIYHGKA